MSSVHSSEPQSPDHEQSPDHGQSLDRRTILKTLAVTPLATVLASPVLAAAAASTTADVQVTAGAAGTVRAALALPEAQKAPAVVLIHEWWGLNDQIRSVAADLARAGYVALAVDLFGGKVATDADAARAQIQAVKAEEATATLVAWINWLRTHERTTGAVATLGWCFGGGWSLNASLATPVDGTVLYYGRVPSDPAVLKTLKGPVLGHFGEKDQSINHAMVDPFAEALKTLGHPAEIHWYDADHAFANPTVARYDEADAKLAWERTMAFLKATIG